MPNWLGTTMITPRSPGCPAVPFLLACSRRIPIFDTFLTVRRNLGHWLLDAEVPSSQAGTKQPGSRLISEVLSTQKQRVARRVCVA